MSAAIHRLSSAELNRRFPGHGVECRMPLEAIVDGLTHVPPAVRLNEMASAFVESFGAAKKPITLTDRKIVIDPVSEEIPLDLIEG
jgi:hypothetical protein